MKNIHVLPTDKPSRLHLQNGNLVLHRLQYTLIAQHIYITSDEEIENCWFVNLTNNEIGYIKNNIGTQKNAKKIILTTDQDLIKDGVQAIDDEFLEWLVKNPSCEFVEVEHNYIDFVIDNYKILIPNEEQKQETLEEVAENYANYNEQIHNAIKEAVKFGAKWQQQQNKNLYSDEDLHNAFYNGWIYRGDGYTFPKAKKEWFEQFKKK